MRPIKFRGKAKDDNEWVFGYYYPKQLISTNEREVITIHCIKDEKFGSEKPISIQTLGQFTGLLDRNGKEIYEGDLLKDNYGEIGEVVWDTKTARFMLFNGGDCWYDYWYIETWAKDKEYEIIGNIHEHNSSTKAG